MPSMAHPEQSRQPTAEGEAEQVILGVDTHQDVHVAAVITAVGGPVADATFPATAAGYRKLLAWARSFGVVNRAGVEGTGCYGAALTRYLRRHHVTVIEVNRPDRAARAPPRQDRHRRCDRGRPRRALAASHRDRQDRRPGR